MRSLTIAHLHQSKDFTTKHEHRPKQAGGNNSHHSKRYCNNWAISKRHNNNHQEKTQTPPLKTPPPPPAHPSPTPLVLHPSSTPHPNLAELTTIPSSRRRNSPPAHHSRTLSIPRSARRRHSFRHSPTRGAGRVGSSGKRESQCACGGCGWVGEREGRGLEGEGMEFVGGGSEGEGDRAGVV